MKATIKFVTLALCFNLYSMDARRKNNWRKISGIDFTTSHINFPEDDGILIASHSPLGTKNQQLAKAIEIDPKRNARYVLYDDSSMQVNSSFITDGDEKKLLTLTHLQTKNQEKSTHVQIIDISNKKKKIFEQWVPGHWLEQKSLPHKSYCACYSNSPLAPTKNRPIIIVYNLQKGSFFSLESQEETTSCEPLAWVSNNDENCDKLYIRENGKGDTNILTCITLSEKNATAARKVIPFFVTSLAQNQKTTFLMGQKPLSSCLFLVQDKKERELTLAGDTYPTMICDSENIFYATKQNQLVSRSFNKPDTENFLVKFDRHIKDSLNITMDYCCHGKNIFIQNTTFPGPLFVYNIKSKTGTYCELPKLNLNNFLVHRKMFFAHKKLVVCIPPEGKEIFIKNLEQQMESI